MKSGSGGDNLSVYIHIPFCEKKCFYCDFDSYANMEAYFDDYVQALILEIRGCEELKLANIISIFIGGGTPSLLESKYVEKIMATLSEFTLDPDAEITIEANPNSLSKLKLRHYKNFGINRLSLGLQAYQNHLLKILGRVHTAEDFLASIDWAKTAGFDNISADLIFALPSQSLADWGESLRILTEAELTHISCYGLTIEENTPFYGMYEPVDERLDRRMYYMAVEFLAKRGYERYEISNFAKASFKSRHNLVYWERGNYLGFGLGAHSLYNNMRFENTGDLKKYIAGAYDERQNIVKLSHKDSMEEFIFLGLRKMSGVSEARFFSDFGVHMNKIYGDVIAKNISSNLVELVDGHLRLTNKGIDLSNIVMSDFLL